MTASGFVGRISVFLIFAGICAVGFLPLGGGKLKAVAPAEADLRELEGTMISGAHLHRMLVPADPPGTAEFCRNSGCHPGLPHAGIDVGPAMRNEHALRMDCLVCHWSTELGSRPSPSWQVRPTSGSFLTLVPPERISRDELTRMRAAVTVRRKCFERGPGCRDCHRPGGITPWLRPGAASSQTSALERIEDYLVLPPGQKWYFPTLLRN